MQYDSTEGESFGCEVEFLCQYIAEVKIDSRAYLATHNPFFISANPNPYVRLLLISSCCLCYSIWVIHLLYLFLLFLLFLLGYLSICCSYFYRFYYFLLGYPSVVVAEPKWLCNKFMKSFLNRSKLASVITVDIGDWLHVD